MRTWTRALASAGALLAVLAVAGCSGSSGGTDKPPSPDVSTTTNPPTTQSASPTPTAPAAALADLVRRGASTAFTADYALDSSDPKQADATVQIQRLDTSYRVAITSGKATAILMTTSDGIVSCQIAAKKTCLLVAKPGQTPPAPFDPGLQRLVTTDIAALSNPSTAITVTKAADLPQSGNLESAQCYTVSGAGVDPGEYCLTQDGVLRRATFPSGTLTLTTVGEAPTRASFTPPVSPTPLPT